MGNTGLLGPKTTTVADQTMDSDYLKDHILRGNTVVHPSLPQDTPGQPTDFNFVVGADTQIGIRNKNVDWKYELDYCVRAVDYINALPTQPDFVCMCGDLVDLEPMMFEGKFGTKEECITVQRTQYSDFKEVFSKLKPDIPMVCICGNHDVGNRPTPESIERFTSQFGDDFFAFWCKKCYMICLNSNLYADNSDAMEQYEKQHKWLEERLQYAR